MMEEKKGLIYERHFTKEGKNVYDLFEYSKKNIDITDDKGKLQFTQRDIEFPKDWSQGARQIVASKYFYGERDSPQREKSVRDLVGRVSNYFGEWAERQNYFSSPDEVSAFKDELAYLALDQRMSFNSPVWFNVGTHWIAGDGTSDQKIGYIVDLNGESEVKKIPVGKDRYYPQTSACFIQSVEDTMEGIMQLAVNEALLFKYGSGTGTNLSSLRSSKERLSGGGRPSGPLAYWAFYDKVAGIVKSGGKTRRAAKMDILDVSHPDIMEFIKSKQKEEEKIHILVNNGIDSVEAQESVNYQNTNISVRATDDFMKAAKNGGKWKTIPVHSKDLADMMPEYFARDILKAIAEGTYSCGDPGMQFHDTINDWHTAPNTAPIRASNPCSEYMHVDNSSCNLASLNLMKFFDGKKFQIKDFQSAVRTTAIAQDLEFDNSSFPTEEIARNSHRLRNLGMGYANLGSLIMSLKIPYDSPEARAVAASITALQTGSVYEVSAEMAREVGPFKEYEKNRESMLRVMRKHRAALDDIEKNKLPSGLENVLDEAYATWERVIEKGERYGFRNAQATVLAPTGTIGFMMDCDTLGVEPEIGLVQTKKLADGQGTLRRVNGLVAPVLRDLGYDNIKVDEIKNYIAGHESPSGTPHLKSEHYSLIGEIRKKKVKVENGRNELKEAGYNSKQIEEIISHLDGHETIEGAPHVREEHLAIFDCSNKPGWAKRTISSNGHVDMMAAVQPFISGAISKTVNVPKETTVEKIEQIYTRAWEKGLKAIAIYRDGSKGVQVLSFRDEKKSKLEEAVVKPFRKKLPTTRNAVISKFEIGGHEGYLKIGMYDDGTPGELFIDMNKEGSTLGGLMDTIGILSSMALQYGVPMKKLVEKFKGQKFEPRGLVTIGYDGIRTADSIMDYVAQFFEKKFENGDKPHVETVDNSSKNKPLVIVSKENEKVDERLLGSFCAVCGSQMIQKGHCTEVCNVCDWEDPKGCGQ